MRQYQIGPVGRASKWEARERHFESIYKKYYRNIYHICQRYSSTLEDAKDLTHDVFLLYILNFEKFRHESCPSTWMYKVAINLAIRKWRQGRNQQLDATEFEFIADKNAESENSLLAKITLQKILNHCPDLTQKILSLFHVDRMTQVEIGEMLGISRSTVTRHLVHLKRFHPH